MKIIIQVLDAVIYAVTKGPSLYYTEHQHEQSLLSRLIAVHLVYRTYQKEIMWLGQLTALNPGIIVELKHMDGKNFSI